MCTDEEPIVQSRSGGEASKYHFNACFSWSSLSPKLLENRPAVDNVRSLHSRGRKMRSSRSRLSRRDTGSANAIVGFHVGWRTLAQTSSIRTWCLLRIRTAVYSLHAGPCPCQCCTKLRGRRVQCFPLKVVWELHVTLHGMRLWVTWHDCFQWNLRSEST